MHYLSDYVYQQLYQALMEEDPTGNLAGQFEGFFTSTGNGYWAISDNNLSSYETWLKGLFGNDPEDWGDFILWDPNAGLQSGLQGGGFKILP